MENLESHRTQLPSVSETVPYLDIKNNLLQERVDIIVQQLIRKNHLTERYRVTIFSSDLLEVIHAQNNKIYLSSELLKEARSNDEIAFIIAHEMAHWENNDMKGKTALIPISQEQLMRHECEADRIGLVLAVHAGFHQDAILQFIKRMETKHGRQTCNRPAY